jgi:hypothetical protein
MKWCALMLAAASVTLAAPPKTFTGVIHDNRCVGPNCATQCPITKGPKYTLQSGEDAWVLSDQKTPAHFTGKKVIVTGTLEAGNKLKVVSIAPAR